MLTKTFIFLEIIFKSSSLKADIYCWLQALHLPPFIEFRRKFPTNRMVSIYLDPSFSSLRGLKYIYASLGTDKLFFMPKLVNSSIPNS